VCVERLVKVGERMRGGEVLGRAHELDADRTRKAEAQMARGMESRRIGDVPGGRVLISVGLAGVD